MARIIVIDTETGGLDAEKHSILTLAAVLYPYTGKLEEQFNVAIAEPSMACDSEALRVNKIKIEEHKANAISPAQALVKFCTWLDEHNQLGCQFQNRPILSGHNVDFDIRFLNRLTRLAGYGQWVRNNFSIHTLDTKDLLLFLQLLGKFPGGSLAGDRVWPLLGVPPERAHTALDDAIAACKAIDVIRQRLDTSYEIEWQK